MKIIIFFIGIISICNDCYSQSKYTYLVVKLNYDFDKENDKVFYTINAEPGNPNANEVYGLRPYKLDKKTINRGGSFFSSTTNTDTAVYNYFQNGTEALMFLAQKNWELLTVCNQITSDYSLLNNHPYTTISSYPVYYFKKEIR